MTELFDWGVDTNKVSVQLYENVRLERKIIETMAFSTLNLLADGKAAVAYVTQEMLEKSGALSEETENVIRELRSIAGVEYAAFLKEKGPGNGAPQPQSKDPRRCFGNCRKIRRRRTYKSRWCNA